MRAIHVPDVCDRLAAELRWPRHSPARHDKFALAVRADTDNGSHLVGKIAGERREVARSVVLNGEQVADRQWPSVTEYKLHGCDYAAILSLRPARRKARRCQGVGRTGFSWSAYATLSYAADQPAASVTGPQRGRQCGVPTHQTGQTKTSGVIGCPRD